MNFVFKFDKVKLIQFFIILMVVVRGNTRYVDDYFPGPFYDCVTVGTHECASGTKCEEIKLEKPLEKPEKPMHFPWKVEIEEITDLKFVGVIKLSEEFQSICDGILISNKHALTAASCIRRKFDQGKSLHLPFKYTASRIPYQRVKLPNGESVPISMVYVHKNYSNSSHDFDISIIEFENVIRLDRPFIYPAILPQAPLSVHNGNQLHVAVSKGVSENYLERINASIWSNDECALNADHLMCIETEFESNCDNWVQPNTFSKQNTSPIFYISNDTMEIFGIPLGCKRIGSPISKSALVYLRVADFLPWIQNIIFNGGAKCVAETPNIQDAVVFEGGESVQPEWYAIYK